MYPYGSTDPADGTKREVAARKERAERAEPAERDDNFEFEENVPAAGAAGSRRRRGAAVALALALIVTLLLALALHDSGAEQQVIVAASPSASVFSATPALLTSTPPANALAPAPVRCPAQGTASASLGQITYYATPAYGISPVWMLGLYSEQQQRIVHFERYPPLPYTAQGWRWRILMVSAPGYSGLVTLSGAQMGGAAPTPLLMDAGSGLKPLLTLNPLDPTTRGQRWAEWPIYVFLPGPGCYQMSARWPGGNWQITFAAGA
jgi:hypothetical protein